MYLKTPVTIFQFCCNLEKRNLCTIKCLQSSSQLVFEILTMNGNGVSSLCQYYVITFGFDLMMKPVTHSQMLLSSCENLQNKNWVLCDTLG